MSDTGYVGIDQDYFVSIKEVLDITAETGALETQTRVKRLIPANVEKIVRCKDCKYWTQFDNAHDFGRCNCSELKDTMDSFELYDEVWLEPKRNFYCGYGERKEQEHD